MFHEKKQHFKMPGTQKRKAAAKIGGILLYKSASSVYINKAPTAGELSPRKARAVRAGVTIAAPMVGYGIHKGAKKIGVKHMARKGVTRIRANEAQGTAGMKQQSKGAVGSGFKRGLDNMVKASKDASPLPKKLANNTGKSLQPRKGVWNPGAERP